MAKGNTTMKQHVSMRGKIVDMELIRKKNELTPAIGNARVNARGDELGPGGKITRKREDIARDYYESNPNSVKDEDSNAVTRPTATPDAMVMPTLAEKAQLVDEWQEDADGNFIKPDTKTAKTTSIKPE